MSADELAAQEAADLPDREAMTLLDPSTVLGGTSLPSVPAGGTTSPAPAPAPSISLPHLPVPTQNPGGTYQPDTSASSHTTS